MKNLFREENISEFYLIEIDDLKKNGKCEIIKAKLTVKEHQEH